jgi:hypothetical protein
MVPVGFALDPGRTFSLRCCRAVPQPAHRRRSFLRVVRVMLFDAQRQQGFLQCLLQIHDPSAVERIFAHRHAVGRRNWRLPAEPTRRRAQWSAYPPSGADRSPRGTGLSGPCAASLPCAGRASVNARMPPGRVDESSAANPAPGDVAKVLLPQRVQERGGVRKVCRWTRFSNRWSLPSGEPAGDSTRPRTPSVALW